MLNDDGEVKIIVVNIVGEEFLLEFDNLLLTCINTKEVEFKQFFLEDFNGFHFQKKNHPVTISIVVLNYLVTYHSIAKFAVVFPSFDLHVLIIGA